MNKIDFAAAKKQIEEIGKIVEVCPEPLKELCFKLLFDLAFSDNPQPAPVSSASNPTPPPSGTPATDPIKPPSTAEAGFKLASNMLAFTRKYEVSAEMLQKLFILDHEPLLPVYKITTKVTATAQLQKVLMVLLENGLLNNSFRAPYAEVREAVSEVGLRDGNFNKVLKRNSGLFKGAVYEDRIEESETVELTGEGFEQLAKLIKELSLPNG